MSQTDYHQIVQLLCDRLADLSKTPEESISPETNLITQLSIDSIKLLGLIMEIEDAFDISIPINALTDIQTVHELAELVHKIKSAS